MHFRDPVLLILALLIPLLVFLKQKYSRVVTVKFSALDALKRATPPSGRRFPHLPLALRCAAIFLIVFALARPLRGIGHTRVYTEGIDIILALDVSSSMDARDMTNDLQVNRLDVAKEVVRKFIPERKNDRLGVVAFARYAYMQSPLTLDHDLLIDIVDRLQIVPRGGDEDGTAIGSAIVTSVARLKDSKGKSKVIILMTDGMNNFGEISPESAAEIAKSMKVKIYTIGIGTKGLAPYPVEMFGQIRFEQVKIDVDEESLQKIAATTGGQYYRAQDDRALKEIYNRINKMEKVKIEEEKYTEFRELFPYLLLPAFLLLLAEIVVSNTILRRLP
jgi:Ca-activated chloride channel homolog